MHIFEASFLCCINILKQHHPGVGEDVSATGYDQAKAETAGDGRNQKLRWHHFGALEKRTQNRCAFLTLPEFLSWKFCRRNLTVST